MKVRKSKSAKVVARSAQLKMCLNMMRVIGRGKVRKPIFVPDKLKFLGRKLKEAPIKQWCIYFLLEGETIVYVGISQNVGERLAAHKKTKKFDRVLYVEAPSYGHVFELEVALIKLLRPKYNSRSSEPQGFRLLWDISIGDELVKNVRQAFKAAGLHGPNKMPPIPSAWSYAHTAESCAKFCDPAQQEVQLNTEPQSQVESTGS
jgi:hypothetical protein